MYEHNNYQLLFYQTRHIQYEHMPVNSGKLPFHIWISSLNLLRKQIFANEFACILSKKSVRDTLKENGRDIDVFNFYHQKFHIIQVTYMTSKVRQYNATYQDWNITLFWKPLRKRSKWDQNIPLLECASDKVMFTILIALSLIHVIYCHHEMGEHLESDDSLLAIFVWILPVIF